MLIPNDAVCVQIDGHITKPIPRSEWARLLRFLWLNRDRWVSILDIIIEMRTSEIPARLSQLGTKFGIPVERKPGSGRKKLYRLDPSVVVVAGACNG